MNDQPPDDRDERTSRSDRSDRAVDRGGDRATRREPGAPTAVGTATDRDSGLDRYLPDADVDSRWWYWIAAVPVYFVLLVVAAVVAFVAFAFGFALDVAGLGGLASLTNVLLFSVAAFVLALPGLVLAVLFPLAIYVDAKAVARSGSEWSPDAVLYGLVALAGVIVTNFVVSVPLAVYYLYLRHEHVGTP
ncbi:hypothetical protein [Halegenticoccus tardaugens]|uniref:hypothetical protein n=1 Tax=Halegenticoccus tardaugens TaxID=2071624 RepID=UPI00100B69DC|nr:hypothetical protein [Halegenticoccus tardaugens]